jgi:hypothetical protein
LCIEPVFGQSSPASYLSLGVEVRLVLSAPLHRWIERRVAERL